MLNASRKIVLFLPPYAGKVLGPPFGLLCLAGALREANYEPVIIDGALDRDYERSVEQEIADCLCFGVSLLTGPMIRDAIGMARLVKRLRPELPVIFGGWHPSLLPDQTLRESFIDIVLLHQGEITLVEIARRLSAGKSLDLVSGCWFKRDGRDTRIVRNPDRPAAPIAALPQPAYDLIDFDAYECASGHRKLPYATSIGCPYACNYCTDMVFYNRRFNAYSAEHVVRETTELAARYRLTELALLDSNFLVDTHRALAIAQALLDRGAPYRWTFQASTDLLCRMSDEDVCVLGASGCTHIGFGVESGSREVLAKMNKRHQHIPEIYEAARKCFQADIRVTMNLIFGYPGETEGDRRETFRVMNEIGDLYSNVTFSPNVFTPYPGIPIWPELEQLGMRQAATLEEWADVDLGSTVLPWLRGGAFRELTRSLSSFLLDRKNSSKRQWLTMRRSLLTGQSLARTLERSG